MATAEATQERYYAARQSAIVVRHAAIELLTLLGRDRLDLLHRMSTNDFESMASGHWRQTVFTNPIGRMIDNVSVLAEPERTLLITNSGKSSQLQDWLRRHIFFQDQVTVEQPSTPHSLWGVYGPKASTVLEQIDVPWPDRQDRQMPGGEEFSALEGGRVWRVGSPLDGFQLLVSTPEIERKLSEHGGQEPDSEAFEIRRIEAGLPASGREILDDSIPLEVGLREAISFSKGCYTGQEIIARLDSRGRLAKQLVGLRLSGPLRTGSELKQGGRTVGTVTSVADSPSLGWIGLGSVKPTAVSRPIVDEAENEVEIIDLPFVVGEQQSNRVSSQETGG